jgi:hypothetical protein
MEPIYAGSTQLKINATPELVFALIADVKRVARRPIVVPG